MSRLRAGVLRGRAVAVAGTGLAPGGDALERVSVQLAALGARVEQMVSEPPAVAGQPGEWAAAHGPFTALVFDAEGAFGPGRRAGLVAVLDRCWACVLEMAGALTGAPAPAKIVLIGPRPQAGEFAGAARAALDNLARSLSVEWARHRVTACAIWPGATTTAAEMSELVCFLLSPAGEYFSGCRLELGDLGATR